ncbi:MAG: GntR family transcriptional regulator [Actinobacteria bacterium]|nr:GntR family transcriptional regulator [Actinomycetota bacterium]
MEDRPTPLYQELAETFRRRIASGELAAGDRLPPVRTAAAEWKCDPGTVARAYALLAGEGLVLGRRGGGTRVMPGAINPARPGWGWAALVDRAEAFLLEAAASGHSTEQAESALAVAAARWDDVRRSRVSQPPSPRGAALRFAGSHDLALEVLIRTASETLPIEARFVGSLGGLMALARDEADVAGSHLWDETTGDYNIAFVRRLLPGRPVVLLTLAHRTLGLIVAPGNPLGISGLADLPGVRFVNRQRGSGTRVWLDAHLRDAGIDSSRIEGYDREERTHIAIARAVERGHADAGLGIGAAAAASGLGFVPLTRERYDLVFPAATWETGAGRAIAALVRSGAFGAAVEGLGGYDPSETGTDRLIQA